jgi:hypothetical protein
LLDLLVYVQPRRSCGADSGIEGYLAASKELGSAPEKPASGKVMLRIAPEIHAAALKAAARSGTSLNKWAEGALGKAARKPGSASAKALAAGVEISAGTLAASRSKRG